MAFLPVNREDMAERGWEQLDFLFISGDAYVDHPSFGLAIISRVLESKGYKVGIIAQPDWKRTEDFSRMGRPRLGVLISSGVIDSMVNHYTASKKKRNNDLYSPGGKSGCRPDRAVIVYGKKVREAFGNIPVIMGGIEASLRRFSHYDYWDNKVRRSVLIDSGADIICYGMGEKSIVEIAERLNAGIPVSDIWDVRGTVLQVDKDGLDQIMNSGVYTYQLLDSHEEVANDKEKYARTFKTQYEEQDAISGRALVQKQGSKYVVQNPPSLPMSEKEMDRVYSLPYERTYHPSYEKDGGIPAIKEVKFSITSHRGCYGGCSFCALTFHQGRAIQKRSSQSIINEAKKLTWEEDFKGYIHDVGGPTANFRNLACKKQLKSGVCKNRQCLFPTPCKNLIVDHSEYLSILRTLRAIPKVKKVFIRSGIRFDYLMLDKNDEFFRELCQHHVSGQLKVAPEHVSNKVLKLMGKPGNNVYNSFVEKYKAINAKLGKEQYIVPYLMSSHPGSDLNAAIDLAVYLKENRYMPEQVQDFYPTPGTLSTCMFYTGIDPRTMKPVHVSSDPNEKAMQRALLQYGKPENRKLVLEALKIAGRTDLIGNGPRCLVRDDNNKSNKYKTNKYLKESGKNVSKNNRRKESSFENKRRSEKRSTGTGAGRDKTGSGRNYRGK